MGGWPKLLTCVDILRSLPPAFAIFRMTSLAWLVWLQICTHGSYERCIFCTFCKAYREKCLRWIKACYREDFTIDNVTKDTYICWVAAMFWFGGFSTVFLYCQLELVVGIDERSGWRCLYGFKSSLLMEGGPCCLYWLSRHCDHLVGELYSQSNKKVANTTWRPQR